jgi:hypothetical protein
MQKNIWIFNHYATETFNNKEKFRSVVVKNIHDGAKVFGVPAKEQK